MIILNEQLQEEYRKNDVILDLLSLVEQPEDNQFTSHRWLLESLPKRMIYYYLYSDLLEPTAKRRRILDVGGGYTALTRILLQHHDYCTLDIMAHDDHKSLKNLETSLGKKFWINSDWYSFVDEDKYDLVLANDLFPNVDQRLTLFLDKYLPACQEMRLSLTYYNTHRWYKVKRTEADEVFHMMAWDGMQLKRVLEKYSDRIHEPRFIFLLQNQRNAKDLSSLEKEKLKIKELNLEQLLQDRTRLFDNNRQVCLLNLQGGKP